MEHKDEQICLERVYAHTFDVLGDPSQPILPNPSVILESRTNLLPKLPEKGLGIKRTTKHLLECISPALNRSSLSPNYYGFVTGGITPAGRVAEGLVSLYDQSPQVHLPDQTLATNVEDRALRLLMDLLRFDPSKFSGIFTTGATASNVLGLACGREQIINHRLKAHFPADTEKTVGSLGMLRACRLAGIEQINIYTTMAHSSLYKASSILGLGRSCVHDVCGSGAGISFDLSMLEANLAATSSNSASIVVVSCAEVNTGLFATSGQEDVQQLRRLCDKYGAWLHVDAAFGLLGRMLHGLAEFETVTEGSAGLELADSIASDAHKLLNVPYDCGFFFCRDPNVAQQVFQNPNAAYLASKSTSDGIQSPLNIGLENSRRFRALPVYATMMAYGHEGYQDMMKRQIRFARLVAAYLFDHKAFDLLPRGTYADRHSIDQYVFIIVLFRAIDKAVNEVLVEKINASSRMYVSGTVHKGQPATRIAVSNWQVQPERDIEIVKAVLEGIVSKDLSHELQP
ncbi:hypothetical protein ACLMJK_007875 [Lecanora helva]